MMRLFRRYILGGKSDKTEGTLLAFLTAVAMASFVVWKVAKGIDMSSVTGMVSAFLLTSVAALTGATVVGHLKPHAPPQGPWQGAQDGYPEGDGTPCPDAPLEGPNSGRTVI